MQSPIGIHNYWQIKKNYTPFYFCGYNQTYNAAITYTEHAINLKLSDNKDSPSVCGGGLFKQYVLTAIDFHWDSEHVIDDKRYPLEVQLIHYAKIYENLTNSLNYKDGVAIFSTFFEISKNGNDAIENLIATIPVIKMKIDHPVELLQPVIPRYFISNKMEKFYRYNGSLTTPCFDETVIWTIFSTPNRISEIQLETLKENWLKLNEGQIKNCRELQEQDDRRVYISAI